MRIVLLLAASLLSLPLLAAKAADLQRLKQGVECNGCDLRDAKLGGSTLKGARLRWANLSRADLSGADLSRADLTGADLSGAKLAQADLSAAILQGVNFTAVDLSETRLTGSDMRWSRLPHLDVDLDLEFLDLTGVLLEGAQFKHGIRCAALPAKGGWGCAAESTE